MSITSTTVVRSAVTMVSMSENMENACEARKSEVRNDKVAKPAAMGCSTRIAMSPFSTAWTKDWETLSAVAKYAGTSYPSWGPKQRLELRDPDAQTPHTPNLSRVAMLDADFSVASEVIWIK